MFARVLPLPNRSFFLFGPRGVGKTTWLRQVLPDALWFDLLRTAQVLELTRSPELFRARVEAQPKASWVVVDEVQRLPWLLNEVHALLAENGNRHRFVLSGSSARKLRRLDANLLAGRASRREMLPLVSAELDHQMDLDLALAHGLLPQVQAEPEHAVDILDAYVHTYLREEILQEALTKDFAGFARFLEVAALANGQVVNASGIARDAGVARATVDRFFTVLVDTLIATWLPAWQARARIKEVQRPKFYLFDPGVARAMAGQLRDAPGLEQRGVLLETVVLHELRAAVAYQGLGGDLSYWRTPAGVEVDFVWRRGPRRVGIEVKHNARWRSADSAVLRALVDAGTLTAAFLVYTGRDVLRDGPVWVLPVVEFLRRLGAGKVLG